MEHTKIYEALMVKGYHFNPKNCMEEFDCMLHDEILKYDSVLSKRYFELVDMLTTAVKRGKAHTYEEVETVYDKYENERKEAEINIKNNSEEYAAIMHAFGLKEGLIIGALGIGLIWSITSFIKKLKK